VLERLADHQVIMTAVEMDPSFYQNPLLHFRTISNPRVK
jgi:hypothetical protein